MPTRSRMHQPQRAVVRTHTPKEASRQATREFHTGSKAWLRIRTSVLVRDHYSCVMCGYLHESNEVDHEDGNSWNNDMSNLRTLCKPCHSKRGKQGQSKPVERSYNIA